MKNRNNCGKKRNIDKAVMHAAMAGDAIAINIILQHYEPYINTLATKWTQDIFGNCYAFVEPYLKRVLETQLIIAIQKFKV